MPCYVVDASKECKALSASCCCCPMQEQSWSLSYFSPPGSYLNLQVESVDGSAGVSKADVAGYASLGMVQDRARPGTQ